MSTIKGRADDMLIIRGVNLFHTQVEELISGHILLSANYQLVVQRSGAMDNVRVKVEVNDNEISIERKNEIQSQLAHKIKENIGLSMEVEICDVETIPRSTGGKLNRILDLRNEA